MVAGVDDGVQLDAGAERPDNGRVDLVVEDDAAFVAILGWQEKTAETKVGPTEVRVDSFFPMFSSEIPWFQMSPELYKLFRQLIHTHMHGTIWSSETRHIYARVKVFFFLCRFVIQLLPAARSPRCA
jgi:hypothetical protein